MNTKKILSDIIVHMKYSKFIPLLQRRENWVEIIERNKNMHIKKFPFLHNEINNVYNFVLDKKILPSMRSLQFGGDEIEKNNVRMYNCAFCPISDINIFSEIFFLLLSGTGIGFSVQTEHINNLPIVSKCDTPKIIFEIEDSKEGWCIALDFLIKSYFGYQSYIFDFSKIRPEGSKISSGGFSSGKEKLI